MKTRMDKYKNEEIIPKRSEKHKELYKQIYNAYDEFENLVVPSNSKEITFKDLNKEINSRSDYNEVRDYEDFTHPNNKVIRREKIIEKQKKENEIYDIKELLNKAVNEKQDEDDLSMTLTKEDYLKKLKLDNRKTNLEQVKELYEEIQEESVIEDASLLKTANLSLEILSDLKGDNDKTSITPAIKEEELPDDLKEKENDFYSNNYKFSKKDFENSKYEKVEDDDDDFNLPNKHSGKFFLKVLLLIFGILLVLIILWFIFNYFNRV